METQIIGKGDDAADDVGKIGSVVFGFTADTWGTDAYTINAATLEGDTLRINVSYSGGCETHAFHLGCRAAVLGIVSSAAAGVACP